MNSLTDLAGCVVTAFAFHGLMFLLPENKHEYNEIDQYAQKICGQIMSISQAHPYGVEPLNQVAFEVEGRKYICKL